MDPKNMQNNGPCPLNTVQHAIVLHDFGVQLGVYLHSLPLRLGDLRSVTWPLSSSGGLGTILKDQVTLKRFLVHIPEWYFV